MYKHTHTNIHTYTYIHTHTYTHSYSHSYLILYTTYIHKCTCIPTLIQTMHANTLCTHNIYTQTCIHTYIHIHTRTHTHTHTQTHTDTHTLTYTQLLHMQTSVHTTHIHNIYAHISIHIAPVKSPRK